MSRRRRARRGRHGFTILELVVALALAGIVVLVAFAAVAVAADAAARLRGGQRVSLAALSTRSTLEGWLHAATVVQGAVPFVGTHRAGLGHPADEVAFAVLDGGPLYPGPRHVHLRVDDDPGTSVDGLVAEIRPLRGDGGADTLEIVRGVAGLAVRYRRGATGSRWQDAWHSDRELPSAVELRLVPAAADSVPSPLLALPLVVAVGWEGR